MSIVVPYLVITFTLTVSSSSQRLSFLERVSGALPLAFSRVGSSTIFQKRVSTWEPSAVETASSELLAAIENSIQPPTVIATSPDDADYTPPPLSGRVSFTTVFQTVCQE